MTETEALQAMIPPGQKRPGKYREGVIQIHVTRACNLACFNCTQGSNYVGPYSYISLENFDKACHSLKTYWGVIGVFGGNPAMHPQFPDLCDILQRHIPYEQRGLWCNNPITPANADAMRRTFNPAVSNLNVHLSQGAYDLFTTYWPECRPIGLYSDSRHSSVYVSLTDLNIPPDIRWQLISECDINRHWSAMIGQFRGELRAWFCEIAGAQSILHQDDPTYPDTGLDPTGVFHRDGTPIEDPEDSAYHYWWELPMPAFSQQVRKHCHECGVPLRGYGQLAINGTIEQQSSSHAFIPKKSHPVKTVTSLHELGTKRLARMTDYIRNAQPD